MSMSEQSIHSGRRVWLQLAWAVMALTFIDAPALAGETVPPVSVSIQRLADLPVPVAGGVLFSLSNGDLIYAGGTTWRNGEKVWLTEAHRWDRSQQQWSSATALPHPHDSSLAVSVRLANGGIMLGGDTPEAVSNNTVFWHVDPNQQLNWSIMEPMPFARAAAVGGALADTIVVVGGAVDRQSYARGRTTVWLGQVAIAHDEPRIAWRQAEDYPGEGHSVAAGAVYDGRLYVFGGLFTDDRGAVRNAGDTWSFASDSGWRRHAPLPLPCRGATAVGVPGFGILLAGGWDAQGPMDQLLLYRPQTDTYQNIGPLPVPMAVAAGVYSGDAVYLAGNEDRARGRTRDFFRIRVTPGLQTRRGIHHQTEPTDPEVTP